MSRPVVVYGAGALGTLLAALFSRQNEVHLVGRKPHVKAIRAQGGVRVEGRAKGLYPLQVHERLVLPDRALVLVTVKAYDLASALEELAPGLRSSHDVVVPQNGLGIGRLAREQLGRPVIRGVTFLAACQLEPGQVKWNAAGKTYFPDGEEVLDLWRAADMPAEGVRDMATYVWRKLAINAVINPLSALLDVPNGELLSLEHVTGELVGEIVQVARREGQPLDDLQTHAKVRASMSQTSRNISSMLQDIRRGRRTEIDWINGAIVRLAERHGLETPRHRQLVELIRFLEKRSKKSQTTPHVATSSAGSG